MATTKVNHPDLLDLASDTGATVLPKGTTEERPVSPEAGYIRFNTTDNVMETYDGTEWLVLDTLVFGYAVDYLVVGGGGSGAAYFAGGGGAGGLRTSYGLISGGGASSENPLILTPSTSYTITVGAGGSGGLGSTAQAENGSDSIINGSDITELRSLGGGASSVGGGAQGSFAQSGGSGGGGGSSNNTQSAASGTLGQGFSGGNGIYLGNFPGGGGGGSGEAGTTPPNNTITTGAKGGDGVLISITGLPTYYAGGGGGTLGNNPGGSGGLGGGGNGASSLLSNGETTIAGGFGSQNTGGGGGGGSSQTGVGNTFTTQGGSGVVILRMPTANYSGVYSGNNVTVQEVGDDTIITYNESGTYTA